MFAKSQLACNSIHTDFEITENETVVIQGNYEYFSQLAPDGRNILVVKPPEISYNTDDFRVDFDFSFNLIDNQTKCNYPIFPGSKCMIFGSTAAFVAVTIHTSNNTWYQEIADALVIDGGNINRYNGEYIELKNKDNANVTAWPLSPPAYLKQISKCIRYSTLPDIIDVQPKCNDLISDTIIFDMQNNKEMLAAFNVRYKIDNYLTANVSIKWLTNYFDPNTTTLFFKLNDNLYNVNS
uniref:Uncharacterized protein n=1 Tax=Panagrolaimus sp. ES5 TaxID=591445 RepID=A0AC34GA10_9BILA